MKRFGVFAVSILCAHAAMADGYQQAMERLSATLKGWSIFAFDASGHPSAKVAGESAHNVLLRYPWKNPADIPPPRESYKYDELPSGLPLGRPLPPTDWIYTEILLVPESQKQRDHLLPKINWETFPGNFIHREAAYLGRGDGFRWYANAPLFELFYLNKVLSGGESLLPMAARSLAIHDDGSWTISAAKQILAEGGDASVPLIKAEIEKRTAGDAWTQIYALDGIRTKAADELLTSIYFSRTDNSEFAAYVLSHKPYRPDAAAAYIDMLDKQIRVQDASAAAATNYWTDAIAPLRKILDGPKTWSDYYHSYVALRSLEKRPIDGDLLDAETTLKGSVFRLGEKIDVTEELSTLRKTADKEAIFVIAANLALYVTKADTSDVNKLGRDLLVQTPGWSKKLAALADSVESKEEQARLVKLRALLLEVSPPR